MTKLRGDDMNHIEWLKEVDEKNLDDKKEQTKYKIKYIQEYAKLWIIVSTHRSEVRNINFIDCMCNAGIYKDGDLCTSMEVLSLFIQNAVQYPNYNYNLFLNDYDEKRIETTKIIANKILDGKILKNVHIYYSNEDVNNYLVNFRTFDKVLNDAPSTLNFIDPYNFGDVKLSSIKKFINRYYCEVAFNLFTSDFVRNKTDERIKRCLGIDDEFYTKEEFVQYVKDQLKINKMRYAFPYVFKNSKNSELYQILFITPNKCGLENLKEALFTVFKGLDEYRNTKTPGELFESSLFSEEDIIEGILHSQGVEAQRKVLDNFEPNKVYQYEEFETYIILNTVLQETQILRNVIKPLIRDGKLKKCNYHGKMNYKQDSYIFLESK